LFFFKPSREAAAAGATGGEVTLGRATIAVGALADLVLVESLEATMGFAAEVFEGLPPDAGVRELLLVRMDDWDAADFGAEDFLAAEGLLTDDLATEPLAPFRPVPRASAMSRDVS
jgi:hypothetical protein